AKISPDGQWLAYTSDESKRPEVYIQTFPKPSGQFQISLSGGSRPVWSRDGKELYFFSADQKMMAVEVKPGTAQKGPAKFEAGVPKALFDVRIDAATTFDVGKDGRFVIPTATGEQSASVPMTVWMNWQAGLKK